MVIPLLILYENFKFKIPLLATGGNAEITMLVTSLARSEFFFSF